MDTWIDGPRSDVTVFCFVYFFRFRAYGWLMARRYHAPLHTLTQATLLYAKAKRDSLAYVLTFLTISTLDALRNDSLILLLPHDLDERPQHVILQYFTWIFSA